MDNFNYDNPPQGTGQNFDQDRVNPDMPPAYTQQPGGCQPNYPKKPQKGGFGKAIGAFFSGIWRMVKMVFFGLSILGNLVILLIVIAVIAAGYSGYKGKAISGVKTAGGEKYSEYVVTPGNADKRIALLEINNIITVETSEMLRGQLSLVLNDPTVKGVLVRIQSPGGSVVASDQIHHLITELRKQKNVPIMAYMAGLGTSGGYYTAVACERVIAEPTTITGSIGVLMQTFTLKELFETKLGVKPVTIKSGEKKDWPNAFKDISEKQLEYIDNKLISPAYKRFVDLVDKGRPQLSRGQILPLADGSIYYAQEAMDKGLIDQIGYLEDAISTISNKAGIMRPEVFGYQQVFGFSDLLQINSAKNTDIVSKGTQLVSEAQSPKLMYLWQLD